MLTFHSKYSTAPTTFYQYLKTNGKKHIMFGFFLLLKPLQREKTHQHV